MVVALKCTTGFSNIRINARHSANLAVGLQVGIGQQWAGHRSLSSKWL